ncbi:TetR/AcrR family transcriptional regulator [Methylocapsa sp. S129]|uniref:TetR/AcrR family transcriptional regulator n=1 Tax=Methylocapsa sp. S129 TaxID=1641869 RepID=UPI00131CACE4|nr:TetR/AcrR family transcriptional regulator [Methylocapsa sp. S129]
MTSFAIPPSKLAKSPGKATKRSGKRADKKRELAGHAISTLGVLGYARTSLRDIASQSGVSLGVLHYYFEDKVELITYCVKLYKQNFVELLDAPILSEGSPAAVIDGFIDGLVGAIAEHASTHRLWYDIRAQALFDEAFHSVVREIEDALIALVGRFLKRLNLETMSAFSLYLLCDSLFRYYLQQHLSGDERALAAFRAALVEQFAALKPGV